MRLSRWGLNPQTAKLIPYFLSLMPMGGCDSPLHHYLRSSARFTFHSHHHLLMRLFKIFLTLSFTVTLLAGCGWGGALLSPISTEAGITQLTADGTAGSRAAPNLIVFDYNLGQRSTIKAYILAASQRYYLRNDNRTRDAGGYQIAFDGSLPVSNTNGLVRQVLPVGDYQFVVEVNASGQTANQQQTFRIVAADTMPPTIDNLAAAPTTISPNDDAIDDSAQLTYRLAKAAKVSATATDITGTTTIVQPPLKVLTGEHALTFNGKQPSGSPLPDGAYTVTVQAADAAGNVFQRSLPISVEGGSPPSATAISVDFSPTQVIVGSKLHVRIKVRNTGKTTLRTQGPPGGFTYTTNDTYASIGCPDAAGFWRVGVDWNNNRNNNDRVGAPLRYPFRWGLGHDLKPGEETTVEGDIVIYKPETSMTFYAGLLQEGISIAADGLHPTNIQVSIPSGYTQPNQPTPPLASCK